MVSRVAWNTFEKLLFTLNTDYWFVLGGAECLYTVSHGVLRSCSLYRMARCLLLWAQCSLRSIRAVHLTGKLNQGADILSQGNVSPGEWRLHPQMIQIIWLVFEKEEVDLFALEDNFHCPIYFSKEQDALVHNWPNVHLPLHYIYAFSRRLYPKRLTVHSGYTFSVSLCVPWELNPQCFCTPNAMLYHWATGTLVCLPSDFPVPSGH